MNSFSGRSTRSSGFTFVELLVSTVLIILLMMLLVSMTDGTARTWRYATSKIEQFQGSRIGFESMTRRLSQATLNTYWDVDAKVVATGIDPKNYIRNSELRFISGPMSKLVSADKVRPTDGVFFQAPIGFVDDRPNHGGLNNLLNTWGYYLEVSDQGAPVPTFLADFAPKRRRSRLMEFMQPSERLSVYKDQLDRKWFTEPLTSENPPVRALSENVIALILLPKLTPQDEKARKGKPPLAPDYLYDSTIENTDQEINPRHQLPPIVQVTMVAIDEPSAARLAAKHPDAKNLGLSFDSLFQNSLKLEETTNPPDPGDLGRLEKMLIDEKLTYRIFTTNVGIRGAKWAKENKDK